MRRSFAEHQYPLLFLTISCLSVYCFSLGHEFVPLWDDAMYVLTNAAVQGFSLEHLKAAFTRNYSGNYAPLPIVSYMLDYTLWGLKPAGFILSNIVLHAANGLLFYGLLLRSRCDRITATAAAFIFLLHPVQVESVVWISQRKTVLAMLFFLISFHYYLSYREAACDRKTVYAYLASLAAFLLALLSKSVVVILPVALLLHDLAFSQSGTWYRRLKDKVPYILMALAAAVVTFYSQDAEHSGGRRAFHGGSPLATFLTMVPVLTKYIRLVFWPTGLSLKYDMPIRSGVDEEVLLSGIMILMLCVLGMWLFKRRRDLFCWYVLFFVGLLPVSQVVPIVTLMNDRYLYFPLLGGAVFIGSCGSVLIGVVPDSWNKPVVAVACILLLMLPVLSFKQSASWQNTCTLWQQVVTHNPKDKDSRLFLADEHFRRGEMVGALEVSLKTLQLFPDEAAALKTVAMVYSSRGEVLKAREYLVKGAAVSPRDIELLLMLAENYLATGNHLEAKGVYWSVLSLNPTSERALRGVKEIGALSLDR